MKKLRARAVTAGAWVSAAATALMMSAVSVFANDPDPDPADVLGNLTGNTTSTEVDNVTTKFLGIFRSGYTFVMSIGFALIVIALIWAAIKMVVASGGNEREKVKSDILRILLCGVGLGAVIVIISLMLSIGAKVGE